MEWHLVGCSLPIKLLQRLHHGSGLLLVGYSLLLMEWLLGWHLVGCSLPSRKLLQRLHSYI